MPPGWAVLSTPRDLLGPELFESWDVCFAADLDVLKTALIALEIRPSISKLTCGMKVKKKKSFKSIVFFPERELPKAFFFFCRKSLPFFS